MSSIILSCAPMCRSRVVGRCMVAAVSLLIAAACTLGEGSAAAPATPSRPVTMSSAPATVASPSPSPSALPPLPPSDPDLMVHKLKQVPAAVIRIAASGDFYDPGADVSLDEWEGSGFIVADDGTAVTNAHIAARAESLTAYVGGDQRGVQAKIIGFVPCSDVAVIRLAGSGYRWLPWVEQVPRPPADVWVFGHPGGSVDVRRAKGRVHQATTGATTSMMAIRHDLRSSVPVEPGSSGGPMVDRDGAVVGVVYGTEERSTQAWAVSTAEAEPAVTRIRQGHPADIGVAGYATVDDGQPVAGVRVHDVAPKSPARRADIRRGDTITHIDGVRVGQDLKIDSYCQALHDHAGRDPVQIELVRSAQDRRYEAALGEGPLRDAGSLDVIDNELLPVPNGNIDGAFTYTTVTDETGMLRVDVPSAWRVDGQRVRGVAEAPTPSVSASVDLDRYLDTWAISGLTVLGSSRPNAFALDRLLRDMNRASITAACVYDGRHRFRNARYRGRYDLYTGCGEYDGATVVVARMQARDESAAAALVMLVRTPRDLGALDRALDSLVLTT